MPSSPNGPLRRGQLVAPFGVGAMVIIRGGIGLVTCGLDHWYKYEDGTTIKDPQEFQIEEWRLQRALRVSHFRLPPDYRRPQKDVPNADLTVPFLKFPQWHFCPGCRRLEKRPLTERSKVKCPECEKQRRTRYMVQVPFVAMCDQGHLQDFPWREWVHKSAKPTCTETLRLVGT